MRIALREMQTLAKFLGSAHSSLLPEGGHLPTISRSRGPFRDVQTRKVQPLMGPPAFTQNLLPTKPPRRSQPTYLPASCLLGNEHPHTPPGSPDAATSSHPSPPTPPARRRTSMSPPTPSHTKASMPSPQCDNLTTLPPELLHIIASHLPPQTYTDSPPHPPKELISSPVPAQRHFDHHVHLFALSCTCKHLHGLLSPELVKGFLAAEEGDPLAWVIKHRSFALAKRLLEEGWVKATQERLNQYMERWMWLAGDQWMEWLDDREKNSMGVKCEWWGEGEVRTFVIKELVRGGAARGLGKDWHAMMGLRWPGSG